MIGVQNPTKEIQFTMMAISEFDIHFMNGVLALGFSIYMKSIKNIDIKSNMINTSDVTFECEINHSSYEEIPSEKRQLTITMGKKLAQNFLMFVKAFQTLQKRIEDNKVFMFTVHTNGVKDPTPNPATKNYMINCTYYIDTELGEVLLARPSGGTVALREWSSPFMETLEKFDLAIRDSELLTGLNQQKLLDHKASDLVDSIMLRASKYEGGEQESHVVIKGEENFLNFTSEQQG